ncbi:response regulator transcription factor [Sphaerotilus sp.]|uniref:response regulator transcription factor n=1 Tax=Sphaerotilus sp. TaxID=2093942 RepID=UPI0034E2149E
MTTSQTPTRTIHLVDDEEAVRDALAFLFETHGLEVHRYASGPDLLAACDAGMPDGCILLDVRMEPMSGLQVHDALIARGVRLPVIFLTGHGDIPMAVDALHKGAFDFVEKPFSDTALVLRVMKALDLAARQRHSRAAEDALGQRLTSLTEREREVMLRVAAGKLNKVIADELCVSVRTIEVHRARVYDKLSVRSAAEVAALLARRRP